MPMPSTDKFVDQLFDDAADQFRCSGDRLTPILSEEQIARQFR